MGLAEDAVDVGEPDDLYRSNEPSNEADIQANIGTLD